MSLRPEQLQARLAGGVPSLALVAGEEPLLVQEAADAIRAAARAVGHDEREVLDAGRDFDWSRLAEVCATGSLFAARRIVELRLDGLPGEPGGRALREQAARPQAEVLLLVVAGRLDGRARNSAWFGAFDRGGLAVYAWPVRPTEFTGWLAQRARRAGLALTPPVLTLIAERTEGNLLAAAQELDRLALLYPDGRPDLEAVARAVGDSAHFESFDWNDKLLAGDAIGASRGLRRLRDSGAAIPALVGALAYDLRVLARAGAGGALPVPRSRQEGFTRAARRMRPAAAHAALARLAEIDALVKRGAEALAWEELLTLALNISGARPLGAGR